jgi:hypothetical protein
MSAVVQTAERTFEQRLSDFSPELGRYLAKAWDQRLFVHLGDARKGRQQLYALYCRGEGKRLDTDYNHILLGKFFDRLKEIARGRKSWVQEASDRNLPSQFDALDDAAAEQAPGFYWNAFYHVGAAGAIKRVYVHCPTIHAALDVMASAVPWLDQIPGFIQIKVCGPGGMSRHDTIVSYQTTAEAQAEVLQRLQALTHEKPWLVCDGLPDIVRRVDRGLGTADNQPKVKVTAEDRRAQSVGDLYAMLAWTALKSTPNVAQPMKADGRHFLDNMLFLLRSLQVDPLNPSQFPARNELEALQRAGHHPN